jgi:hypothetical protein
MIEWRTNKQNKKKNQTTLLNETVTKLVKRLKRISRVSLQAEECNYGKQQGGVMVNKLAQEKKRQEMKHTEMVFN